MGSLAAETILLSQSAETKQGDMGAATSESEVALLTGGIDRPYAFGLSMALASKGVSLDVIGSRELDSPEMHAISKLKFLRMHADERQRVGKSGKKSYGSWRSTGGSFATRLQQSQEFSISFGIISFNYSIELSSCCTTRAWVRGSG